MKKQTVKRLSLSRETVRELSQGALVQVAGAAYTQDLAPTCRKQPPPPSVGMANPCDI